MFFFYPYVPPPKSLMSPLESFFHCCLTMVRYEIRSRNRLINVSSTNCLYQYIDLLNDLGVYLKTTAFTYNCGIHLMTTIKVLKSHPITLVPQLTTLLTYKGNSRLHYIHTLSATFISKCSETKHSKI